MIGYNYLLSAGSGNQNIATITEGDWLYSDRTGIEANPNGISGYRTFEVIGNKLVSINQKFILVLQMDGNLQIRTGNFTKEGNLILPNGQKIIAPNELGPATEVWNLGASNLPKIMPLTYKNGPYGLNLTNTEIMLWSLIKNQPVCKIASFPAGGVKFLFLENSGDLVVTVNGVNIWRLSQGNINEPVNPANPNPDSIPGINNQNQNQQTTGGGSSWLYILGALVGGYFFLKRNGK